MRSCALQKPPALVPVGSTPVGLTVCEGCCCGQQSSAGRPGVGRLQQLADEHPELVSLRISGCLGRCDDADVVVVRPSAQGRRRGGRPVWLGLVGERALECLRGWLADGGPGLAELPAELALHVVGRPLRELTA